MKISRKKTTEYDSHVVCHSCLYCLRAHAISTHTYDYLPSNWEICRYSIGKVIGAGSFGVVRQVTEKATGRKFACKTISKVPKRGSCTPRYLLKIQTEVDVMQQLGASLDSVSLKASPVSLSNSPRLICGLSWVVPDLPEHQCPINVDTLKQWLHKLRRLLLEDTNASLRQKRIVVTVYSAALPVLTECNGKTILH